MNYQEAIAYIHSFEKFGWDLTLDRLQKLLENLGNPQNQLAVIHVAGTNGKGSVCNLCANALMESGYKTGLYTSPFVVDFRERFQINGNMISPDRFAELTQTVKNKIDDLLQEGIHITEFEAITAIAFLWFAEENCDFTVLEVGLGGRFDATNVITKPLVCGIASISLDHVNILGDTIAKIAFEKAGIIKEHVPCCIYPKMDPEAEPVFKNVCEIQHAKLIKPSLDSLSVLRSDYRGNDFIYQNIRYSLKLVGSHQIYNALLALSILSELRLQGYVIPSEAVQAGFGCTAFPGRFEILQEEPLIIDDGAHNEEGTRALAQTLSKISKEKYVLMGMLADKDYEDSLAHIGKVADHLYCVPVNNPRALPVKKFAEVARRYCADVSAFDSTKAAVDEVFTHLKEKDLLIGCGSLYLVGDLREQFLKKIKD